MIANNIEFNKGYWYLSATLHCDTKQYRREGGGTSEDWEEVSDSLREWVPAFLDDHCEDLLQAYIANGNKIKQVFVNF
jgi:hypothetical protein